MIRLAGLLLTISVAVSGQDSVLVKATCKKLSELRNPSDVMEQGRIVSEQLMTFVPVIESTQAEKRVKAAYTFQYKMHREMRRSCPGYLIDFAPNPRQRIIDYEDLFTRPEIDSLTKLLGDMSKSKKIYVFVVTIDDYFPDGTITDFSNRNRERWGPISPYKNGTVMIAISKSQRQLRVSTSSISKKYLSDEECDQILGVIIPHFKEGSYARGTIEGLVAMRKRI